MARAIYVAKARKDIYEKGSIKSYEGKAGTKREGRKINKLDRTIPCPTGDKIFIHKGESYYYWQFRQGPVHYSHARPKRSQLTQSGFLSWLFDFEDDVIGSFGVSSEDIKEFSSEDLSSTRDEWVQEIESQKEELQSRLDNMPGHLQDTSSSGQTLTERIEGLDSWIGDLESVDLDWDDKDLRQKALEELRKGPNKEEGIPDEELEFKFLELKAAKIEEIIGELQSQSSNLG